MRDLGESIDFAFDGEELTFQCLELSTRVDSVVGPDDGVQDVPDEALGPVMIGLIGQVFAKCVVESFSGENLVGLRLGLNREQVKEVDDAGLEFADFVTVKG